MRRLSNKSRPAIAIPRARFPKGSVGPTQKGNRKEVRGTATSAAFTLIELLVSSVMAVILLVTLTGVLRAISVERKFASRIGLDHAALGRMSEQLRRDFIHAEFVQIQPNVVRLVGMTALDSAARTPTLRPALVTYQVVSQTGQSWLLRSEVHLDRMLSRPRTDLVWSGALNIDVQIFDDVEDEDEQTEVKPPLPGMDPMPATLLVTVRRRDGSALCAEEILHHVEYQQ